MGRLYDIGSNGDRLHMILIPGWFFDGMDFPHIEANEVVPY